MANEYAAFVSPAVVTSGSQGAPGGGIDDPYGFVAAGVGKGITFPAKQTGSVYFPVRIPNSAALGTGLTFSLLLQDDVLNASAGKVAVFGATVGPITSGTSTFDENATTGPLVSCTEVTATVTMPSTAGVLINLAIAVPIADMNSLAAGGWAMVRLRRLGTNSSETHVGRVLLLGFDVRNT